MNKKSIIAFLALSVTVLFPLYAAELTIYTYESFNSQWGPGPTVFKRFEESCQCQLKIVALGDSGLMLNRVILEKKNPNADIFLGLNDSQLAKALSANIFLPYQSPLLEKVSASHLMDSEYRITPFDYGYIAFVYDSEKISNPPLSLKDLLKEDYKQKIVIEDPRTSSPGLSFLHWTISVYGEDGYMDYWEKLKPNLLAITSGWSAAYGMFTKGETPVVLSYATSPAYHLEYENTERYRAAVFSEGHYLQIEGAGIVKGTANLELAKQFIDFMLSAQFQDVIPLTNWMFPVIEYQSLPASFRLAIQPESVEKLDASRILEKNKLWLKTWEKGLGN